jgi:hypothetical protein
MKTPDARHLSIETQNYLRQQAIRLHSEGKQVKILAHTYESDLTPIRW